MARIKPARYLTDVERQDAIIARNMRVRSRLKPKTRCICGGFAQWHTTIVRLEDEIARQKKENVALSIALEAACETGRDLLSQLDALNH